PIGRVSTRPRDSTPAGRFSCARTCAHWVAGSSPAMTTFFVLRVVAKVAHHAITTGSAMSYETIQYSVADKIATITLNRPEKMNAFTGTMQNELIDAFGKVDADDNVRVAIVTGAGRAFCAGADLSAGAKTFDYNARSDRPDRAGAGTGKNVN